jgi:hypothetical protein
VFIRSADKQPPDEKGNKKLCGWKFAEINRGLAAAGTRFPTSTLADLYDPLMMPAPLLKAHQELDRAVDRCYRPDPFPSDRHRVEYLFALYEKITAPLVAAAKPKRKRGLRHASRFTIHGFGDSLSSKQAWMVPG